MNEDVASSLPVEHVLFDKSFQDRASNWTGNPGGASAVTEATAT